MYEPIYHICKVGELRNDMSESQGAFKFRENYYSITTDCEDVSTRKTQRVLQATGNSSPKNLKQRNNPKSKTQPTSQSPELLPYLAVLPLYDDIFHRESQCAGAAFCRCGLMHYEICAACACVGIGGLAIEVSGA
jgi:hypothetical protein